MAPAPAFDEKDKEIIFLRDKVDQQQLQIAILQKGLLKNNKPYKLREKLFILCYMETFQVARRRVTEHLGIARSTLCRRFVTFSTVRRTLEKHTC